MRKNDASADQSVDLKKSARRRLVGATALALLAVVILPVVMEQEPKPASQDIQVRIPNRDSFSASADPTPNIDKAEAKAVSSVASEQSVNAGVFAHPTENAASIAAKSAVGSVSISAQANSIDQPVEHKKSITENRASKAEEVRAVAVLAGSDSTWLVRLGAYQNAGNVRILLAKIKEMGLPAYSEKFDSPAGPRIRVFAGPFASRDVAGKAQTRIKKIGVEGVLMTKP